MNEIEASPQLVAKKLWRILRVVFFMLRKGASKSKLKLDVEYILHRSSKIAEKAIENLILHHNQLSCRPDDPSLAFISPREYEFSCSASPVVNSSSSSYINHYKRKHHHHYRHHNYRHPRYESRDMKTANAVHKVLDALNKNSDTKVGVESPWFGDSPAGRQVRQLRITDSPFSMNGCEEDQTQVSKAADEFIKKFYTDLKHQNKKADVFVSPYYDTWFG